jgi:hypothetical protein
MSVTLTTLSSDNFNRANQYPLGGLWVIDIAGDQGLAVVNDQADVQLASPTNNTLGYEIYNYSLPNDQFATVAITSTFFDGSSTGGSGGGPTYPEIKIKARVTDIGVSSANGPAYSLLIQCNGIFVAWSLIQETGTQIASGFQSAFAGDTFTIAVVGTTVYALHNGTVMTSVTNTSFASGSAAMWFYNDGFGSSGGLVSLFAVGSAADPAGGDSYNSSIPYLGTVTVVASAPAGLKNPFVGKMLVLASVPPGFANAPYLGHVVQGTPASAGIDTDTLLGQVVVVASAPANDPDPFLGTIDSE